MLVRRVAFYLLLVSPTVRFVAVFGLEVRLVVGFLVVVFAVDFAAVLVVFVAAALAVVFAVAFVRGKGDKQRIVPLPDDLADIIMDARGYLFPGRFVGHVEESYIGDHISHLLPDGYAAHTLRHRFATTAYAATHDLFVVAELLGHESVETTEHYVAMPDGRLREATAAVRLI